VPREAEGGLVKSKRVVVLHRFADQAGVSEEMEKLLEEIMLAQERKSEALKAKQKRLLELARAVSDFLLTPSGPFHLLAPKSERALRWACESPYVHEDVRRHIEQHGCRALVVAADESERITSAIRREGMTVTWTH
jgi:hypothetical protein